MDWQPRAAALADATVHPSSRWHAPIAGTPRHVFVPNWWRYEPDQDGWSLRRGSADPERWRNNVYTDRTLVTRVGGLHADRAGDDDRPVGRPTSSSTLPGLVVSMYRHAMIPDDVRVLCVTGTGYGTALLAHRLGAHNVTSVDVDPHLVETAADRLEALGHRPRMQVCDVTGSLPGTFDRIVSTVGLPGIPPSWLAALNPGGRLVTNLSGTGLVIAADVTPDGGARGFVTAERAGFMVTRTGDDYPPSLDKAYAWTNDGDDIGPGRYPVVAVGEAWELMPAFAFAAPGVHHGYEETEDGVRTAVMVHEDGSWARAVGRRGEQPRVHQSGPRRLWDILDGIRHDWLADGGLPQYGAGVVIDPDGTLHLARRQWSATVPPATQNAIASTTRTH
ncbi:methyltransferase domain-containing protein [Embleya sp. NBC_00896]|uniref:methyltransferase domain-containing protein n=1 Tax=Embleya sp. NBC_00896 TaxID=2975961 RepID=UPI002F91240E|nr:methyltransferase domain-containing protein [Embleya sp. NBC_00896]